MRKTALCYIAVKGKYQDMNQIFLTQFFSSLLWDVRVMMVLDMQEVYWGKYLWRIGEQGATVRGKITVLTCKWGEGRKDVAGTAFRFEGGHWGAPKTKFPVIGICHWMVLSKLIQLLIQCYSMSLIKLCILLEKNSIF